LPFPQTTLLLGVWLLGKRIPLEGSIAIYQFMAHIKIDDKTGLISISDNSSLKINGTFVKF